MSYEVHCRGEHAYFVPMVATQEDGHRQPEIEAEKLRKEIEDGGFTFIESDTQIKLTCYATGEDGLEPTAEWSRFQQALKERDIYALFVKESGVNDDLPPMNEETARSLGGAIKQLRHELKRERALREAFEMKVYEYAQTEGGDDYATSVVSQVEEKIE